jgi:hypothetical protein
MIIDNIGWNVDVIKQMTREQFVNDVQHHGLYYRITDPAERKKALHNAYTLIIGKQPEPIKEEQE